MLCTCNMKNVLCSAEKSSVIWAEPDSKSSAEQFNRTERSVYPYYVDKMRGEGVKKCLFLSTLRV